MKWMTLYDSAEELQRAQKIRDELPQGVQEVYPGELFGYQDEERSFTVSHCGETYLRQERRKPKRKAKEERGPKQSLYAKFCDELLENYTVIRDVQRNIYIYEGGIYNRADSISLAEFVKQNLPETLVWQISDPGFYNKLLLDLKSDCRIEVVDRKKLNSKLQYLVAFQNGIYDCRQGMFLDFSPEILLFSKLEVNYRRHAEASVFETFLDSVSDGDRAIKNLIWEMIAYILLPTNEGKCFFLMGTAPNSGKSLLARLIESMFPDSAVNRAPLSAISGRFGLASLAEKRINIAPECVDERISPEVVNNIKLLTGEGAVNVERKGIDASREYMNCKLLFATNCATSFAVKDEAFWNRMRIVPFLYSIPLANQRTDLFEDLIQELDEIASIAVSKFSRPLIASNYKFTVPDAAARMMEQWRNSRFDSLKRFLDCTCEITRDPTDFIAVSDLYDEYYRWLQTSYSYAEPFAKNDFSRKIRERFIQCCEPREKEKINGKNARVLHGICWLKDQGIDDLELQREEK